MTEGGGVFRTRNAGPSVKTSLKVSCFSTPEERRRERESREESQSEPVGTVRTPTTAITSDFYLLFPTVAVPLSFL